MLCSNLNFANSLLSKTKFAISLILTESMLLNGILTYSEVWYNIKEEHLTILESADNT